MREQIVRLSLVTAILFCCLQMARAQYPLVKPDSTKFGNGIKAGSHSTRQSNAPVSFVKPVADYRNWMISLVSEYDELDELDSAEQATKDLKTALKLKNEGQGSTQTHQQRTTDPYVCRNFEGNQLYNGTPSDDVMAVSNGGIIVTCNNATIQYRDTTGAVLLTSSFPNFFNDPTLNSTFYDPYVLYDPDSDRFIFTILNGLSPSTSKLVVAFSKTSNPGDGWWVYKFSGNVLQDNSWMDYPRPGISSDELFIAANLFHSNNTYNQPVILQINKAQGYLGNTLTWQYWDSINDPWGYHAKYVQPVSFGEQGSYGPGSYFVESRGSSGNDYILLFIITGNQNDPNAALVVHDIQVPDFAIGGDALQLNSTHVLDVGSTRIQSAFYLPNYIYFVLTEDLGGGYNGIRVNRLSVPLLVNSSAQHGQSGLDYAYPTVASFGTDVNDENLAIGYLCSGSSIYPEFRVVRCDGSFNWSNDVVVKKGETYINLVGQTERWGDYSGASRRQNAANPEVWMAGCYGDNNQFVNNGFSAWIAQIKSVSPTQGPTADFSGTPLAGAAPLTVNFSDQTTNNPNVWDWTVTGSNLGTSNVQNPVAVYDSVGTYSVTLMAHNAFGVSTKVKSLYITVTPTLAPVADFTGNPLIGNSPLTVNFSDLSSNNPTSWAWSFQGADSTSSFLQNPTITYSSPGVYPVSLTSSNSAGSNNALKSGYIDVLPATGIENLTQLSALKVSPNPLVDYCTISFSVNQYSEIDISVYDVAGREVKKLFHDFLGEGKEELTFNRNALDQGMYFIRVKADDRLVQSQKIVVF